MNLEPIQIPPQNVPTALLSCVVSLLSKIEVLEMRVSYIAQGKTEMSQSIASELYKRCFEEHKTHVLAKFGE
jgi:hypothetical protein